MTKSYDPNSFATMLPDSHRQWIQSVQQVLNGSVDMGTPTKNAPSSAGINAGVPTQFQKGNSSGLLIRVAAHGVSGTGASYNWGASNVGIVIQHNLGRQPVGFHVVDQDKAGQVFRTAAPTSTTITLAPTDNTMSVTIYVF